MGESNGLTSAYWSAINGEVNINNLTPTDSMALIRSALKSCKSVLLSVFKGEPDVASLSFFLNCPIKGGRSTERRVTSPKVTQKILKEFLLNESWLLIPVSILLHSENKGQFFERQLFIVADLAELLIIDTKYRKVPHLNSPVEADPPLINEKVVSLDFYLDGKSFSGDRKKFEEIFSPYLCGPKFELERGILEHHLGRVSKHLLDEQDRLKELEKDLMPLLDIRRRLGFEKLLVHKRQYGSF